MWPKPDDPGIARRMRAAHAQACTTLQARPAPTGHEAWGWHGRTLGRPVNTPHGPAWLRLHSTRTDQLIDTFWNGAIDAHRSMPSSIPRPRLLGWHDWTDQPWTYRAELYEQIATRPVASRAILTTDPDLPKTWWTTVRTALDDIAAIQTDRVTIHQGFLAWAMPHYLGSPINGRTSVSWATAHGDFHYANLCGPRLCILDWEGWGTAPTGYDAAMLHSYSLLIPTTAARIRHELAHLLDTRNGQFAELAAITELLHTTTHGDNLELAGPLRQRAAILLGRAVPAVQSRPAGSCAPMKSAAQSERRQESAW
jgi:hypothetical protein